MKISEGKANHKRRIGWKKAALFHVAKTCVAIEASQAPAQVDDSSKGQDAPMMTLSLRSQGNLVISKR